MKYCYSTFLAILAIVMMTLSSYGNCGNNCKDLPAGCPCPSTGTNQFSAYTGNLHRQIRDLEIWRGVEDLQLVWMRYYNSRNGWEPWTHGYDYKMTYEGLSVDGREQILVTYPDGGGNMFTRSNGDPNVWLPLPGVKRRLFQQGNNYFLQTDNGYRYRFEKINSTIYGVKYQLQDYRDQFQNLYRLTYDEWHNLLQVTEPAGRFFTIEYAVIHDKLVIGKVKTNDGRSVSYNYTLHNDGILDWLLLSSVDYGDGTSAKYKYAQSEPGRLMLLQHAIDPRLEGKAVNMKYTYDSNVAEGYIKEELNGVTNEVTVTLITEENDRWVCYPNGRIQHYTMPEISMGSVTQYADGLGRITKKDYEDGGLGFIKSSTDALGRTTFYKKSIYGNDLEIIHPDGSKEKWIRDDLDLILSYTDELGRVTVYTRDNFHRITKIAYPDGTNEQFTYNSFGQVLTHIRRNGGVETSLYNNQGLKTRFTNALGNHTHYSYNAADRLASITDALGHVIRYEYNERGLMIKMINADNSFQTYGYDDFGNRTSVTNELGNTWKKVYDEFKRVVSKSDPLNRQTKFTYDLPGGGCGCSHDEDKPTKIVLPGGKTTTIEYNPEWQMIKQTEGAGSSDAATSMYEYDAVDNIARVIDARGKSRIYSYDQRNRKFSETSPLGQTTVWIYDAVGNTTMMKRPDNSIYTYQYDNMNRRIESSDPLGQITRFFYDSEDNLIKLTDPRANNYQYEYDLLNRLTKMIYPDGSTEQNTYDLVNNLKTFTNRSGAVRTYTYDSRNREINSVWSDNTPSVSKNYDAASRIIGLSSTVSTLNYIYDAANELLSETQDISGVGSSKTVSYSYNADGLRSSMTYPGMATVLAYDYTARNQLSSISENGVSLISYAYDLMGNRFAAFRRNGVGSAYSYDDANRTLSITHQKDGVPLAHFDYGYDNLDRRTFVKRDYNKGDVYAYDASDQVIGVQYNVTNPDAVPSNPAKVVNYNYDAAGNRVLVDNSGMVSNYTSNNLNQYTNVGGEPLNYDGSGNLTSVNGWSYTYDAQNRLIKAQKGNTTVELAYDARNRCARRTTNGVTTGLYYDGWNLIEEETPGNIRQYIHGPVVDEIICRKTTTDEMTFYHQDALGNVTHITTVSGSLIEQYDYDIFGKVTIKNSIGEVVPVSLLANRFMFTGRELIPEMELYDYRNRMYSPVIGRFLQTDPIKFSAGDINLYRYVFNDPVNNSDPSGLECCNWWQRALCAGAGGLGALGGGALGGAGGGAAGTAIGGPGAGTLVGAGAGAAIGGGVGGSLAYDLCCWLLPCCE